MEKKPTAERITPNRVGAFAGLLYLALPILDQIAGVNGGLFRIERTPSVLHFNNTNPVAIPPKTVERLFTLESPVLPRISTMNQAVGAGFYSGKLGPLPFAFGNIPAEKYYIPRLK